MTDSVVIDSAVMDSVVIDGQSLPRIRPASVAEAGQLIRDARATGQGIYPVGGRTLIDVGCPPVKPGLALDTTAWTQIIDYPARDMTITVQAGLTIAQLQATLAAEGQWLPIDIPAPERATLGGAIATNSSGPHRWGHGTLRDAVIGISFLSDDGIEVKGGGRVVKNVAGYDLMKLHTGALGTLGLITQVTLKVKPRPEAQAVLVLHVPSSQLAATLDLLHASPSRPVAVELLNAAAAREGGLTPNHDWTLVIGFAEKHVTVEWQRRTLLDELRAAGESAIADGDRAIWPQLTGLQIRPGSRFIWKANVLPSRLAAFVLAEARVPGREQHPIHAQPLNGIVWFHQNSEPDAAGEGAAGAAAPQAAPARAGKVESSAPESATPELMPETAEQHGGAVVTRRAPAAWKTFNRVWGRHPRGDFALMQHIRATLDPDRVFNPGRLFP